MSTKFIAELVFKTSQTVMDTETHVFATREALDAFLEEADKIEGVDDVIYGEATIH